MSIFDNVPELAEEGAELEVLSPDFEQTKYTIKLKGKDSDAFRKFQKGKNRASMNKVAKSGRGKVDFTGDEGYDFTTDMLVALTVEWNLEGPEGLLPCDDETKRSIYTNLQLGYIREQAEAFIESRANFTKKSSTS